MNNLPIIISLGINGIYPKLLERLRKSCIDYSIEHILWEKYPPNSRTHSESPYGFKIYAIEDALKKGHTTIIWCDSACYIVKKPQPFFDLVKENGILFLGHGDRLCSYVNDKSLSLFNFKRCELKQSWLISGSLFGFDFSQQKAIDFFNAWKLYEQQNWFREDTQKPDGIFKQHRHDEAIASLLLVKYGIQVPNAYDYFQGSGSEVMFRAGKDL